MKVDVKYDHKRDCIEVAVRTENGYCHIECVSMADLYNGQREPAPKKRERIHIAPGCDTIEKLNSALFQYTGKQVDVFLSPVDWRMIWDELLSYNQLVEGYDGKKFFMFMNKLVYPRALGQLASEWEEHVERMDEKQFEESPWDKKLREELSRGDDIWGSIAKKYK